MKTLPITSPYGSWKSPITAESIVATSIGLGSVWVDGGDIYWLEKRPQEKGRNVIVSYTEDKIVEITPPAYSVRTRVHEYGGGAFIVVDRTIYFSNYSDGQICRQSLGDRPQALTSDGQKRYADLIVDRNHNRLLCICEGLTLPSQGRACLPPFEGKHRIVGCTPREDIEGNGKVTNTIVTINLATGKVNPLITGNDFYSSPRLSHDGKYLAWLSWDLPDMPWDSTYLWLAEVRSDGGLGTPQCIAGGANESICEPKWSSDGRLYFSSDRNDWWNLYRYNLDGTVEIVWEMAAEFAYPHWVFGLSTYDFIDAERLICTYSSAGSWHLGTIDLKNRRFKEIETNYTNISDVRTTGDGYGVFIAGSPTTSTAVIKFNLDTATATILKQSETDAIDLGYLAIPEAIAFPTENNLMAYGWYYPPKNQDYLPPSNELPPLIVKCHGGPTAAASVDLNLRIQYWTSRGFGYLDVNYGGSIGYGRQYRQRLESNWGIVDVDDCVNGAKYLVSQGRVDGKRLIITGGSAGGYTTLAALTFRDTFKAGASYYGVSDLEILAKDTHKFESRYLDRLVGKYPEEKAIYEARSPIHFTERLACPVIFFQGLEDKVVPPNQAEMMFEAIKRKGLPVAYVPFPEEAHGFRQAANIKKALESEFYFYSRVFGFEPAESIEPVEIVNLI
jgi:dipeptidyl aminopeptidase/acylaminoacyl peptidase